nr:pentatricopeptide repeat-containing protein, chloroplastic [Quercus suber]
MGVSCFERNVIFASNCTWSSFSFNGVLIPRRPIFPIGLTVKKVHVFGVKVQNNRAINALLKGESDNDNRLVGGGILEKELQFKPSFNEYLKAMESVRVRRERKQADNNNNNKLKKEKPNDTEKGLFRTQTKEGDKGNVELKGFEKKKSILDQEKVLKVVKHEGLSKKDYGITSKESQVRRGKLGYKGKASKEFVDEIDTNEGHISGKLMKQHQTSSIQQKLEDSNLGKSTKAWRGESDNDNRLVGGGILEKELQFKPSFNEYLKAMESVRVRRERKQADNNNNNKLKKEKPNDTEKGLFRTQTKEGDKGNVELKGFEKKKSILDQEKVLKVVKHEGLSKKDYGITSKESQVRRGKLGYKGKASKEFVDEIDTNEGHISGKLMKQHQTSSIQQKLEDSNLGKSTKAWRVQKVSKALVPVQRQRHSIKLEGEIVGDASSWGMLRQKGTDNSQWDDKSIKKTLKGEKIGAGIDRHGRRERKYLQVEEVANNDFLREKGTLTRRSHSFSERIDGNGAEEERAAFKNFDEFSDVVDKPRVSRMEMEERIQKLAKQLNGADVDMPEWMFTKTMRSARIRFCDHSILRVIQILGKLGNWRRVLQVIEWLQMRERFKSHRPRFIYTTTLDVLGKANRPVEALNVFHSMQQQVSTYPDLVAYQCIAVTLGKAGFLKELFDVIDSMRSPPKKKFKTGVIGKWDPELEPDIMV